MGEGGSARKGDVGEKGRKKLAHERTRGEEGVGEDKEGEGKEDEDIRRDKIVENI